MYSRNRLPRLVTIQVPPAELVEAPSAELVEARPPLRQAQGAAQRMLLLAALLLGFGLRLYRLGAESLWYDETVSVMLAQKSIPALIAHTAGDIHPPGYYLLLHFWALVTQPTLDTGLEFLFAWPSLFFGMLILPLLYIIGRSFHTASVALLAVFLAAINPYHLWYSQEVRMYTFGAMLGLICLWSLLKFWAVGRVGAHGADRKLYRLGSSSLYDLTVYVVAAVFGLYALYYFAFTLVGLNVIAGCWFVWLILGGGWRGQISIQPPPELVEGIGGLRQAQPTRPEWLRGQARQPILRAGVWLLGQVAVLVLWSPWLPIFWRQATDPPVPPWRVGWTWAQFGWDLLESLSALVAGQVVSSPAAAGWLVAGGWVAGWLVAGMAGVGIAALVIYGLAASSRYHSDDSNLLESSTRTMNRPAMNRLAIVLYLLIPILLIYLLTALVTPLYHVRYLFTYAPVFMIILAAAALWLATRNRWLATLVLAGLIGLNLYGLNRFWNAPAYRADEHRGTVAYLAEQWRPSDLILVNAGWTYPTLQTYWPTREKGGAESYPPQIAATERLADLKTISTLISLDSGQHPLLVRTGSVDATGSLGWGDPKSDFFAITAAETSQALDTLAGCYHRIWHYRIYDTVSDPMGVIRGWLAENGSLQSERWISGRDLGQLQLYNINAARRSSSLQSSVSQSAYCEPTFMAWTPIDFGNTLRLMKVAAPTVHTAGQTLYVTLDWQPLPGLAAESSPLSMSLRLYADIEALSAQKDETPSPTTGSWVKNISSLDSDSLKTGSLATVVRQTLALPLSPQTPPGSYSLELIVYRQQDGMPLVLPELANTIWGQRLRLAKIDMITGK